MPPVNERSIARLALVPASRRSEVARLGGYARAVKVGPERLQAIALAGVAGRMAKVSPERRREIARAAGIAGNRKRWGSP